MLIMRQLFMSNEKKRSQKFKMFKGQTRERFAVDRLREKLSHNKMQVPNAPDYG